MRKNLAETSLEEAIKLDKNRNIETRMFFNILSLHYGQHRSKLRCIRRRELEQRAKSF